MKKEINRLRLVHFGKILSNYAIFGGVILLLIAFIPLAAFIYYVFAALLLMILLFTGLLFTGDYDLFGDTELLNAVCGFMYSCLPYVFAVTAVCAVGSIVFLLFDRRSKHIGRIVIAGIVLFFGIIALVVFYLLGGVIVS